MGEVDRARDTRLGRTVAIKVLLSHVAVDEPARERFEREARVVAGLNHPYICTLHDIGTYRAPAGLGPVPYLVMEYLKGETLAERRRIRRSYWWWAASRASFPRVVRRASIPWWPSTMSRG
jgi:serine/threonine protein kinase